MLFEHSTFRLAKVSAHRNLETGINVSSFGQDVVNQWD
jgi:hypothetical protein